jgi:hypothetical protein
MERQKCRQVNAWGQVVGEIIYANQSVKSLVLSLSIGGKRERN